VVRAVGYRGEPIAGVPFDAQRARIANTYGRITAADGGHTREYVVGWAKRGPSGLIGTNKKCALETVRALIQDMVAGRLATPIHGEPAVEPLLRSRQPDLVTYAGWKTLDHHERQLGQPAGRPRVKLTRVSDMIEVADWARRLSA
jgi:ferredoxin--NADP+ reductase